MILEKFNLDESARLQKIDQTNPTKILEPQNFHLFGSYYYILSILIQAYHICQLKSMEVFWARGKDIRFECLQIEFQLHVACVRRDCKRQDPTHTHACLLIYKCLYMFHVFRVLHVRNAPYNKGLSDNRVMPSNGNFHKETWY